MSEEEKSPISDISQVGGFTVQRKVKTFRVSENGFERATIRFEKPFLSIPVVTYSVTRLDVDCTRNTRYEIILVDVSRQKLVFEVRTWDNTHIYGLDVTFWAMGNV